MHLLRTAIWLIVTCTVVQVQAQKPAVHVYAIQLDGAVNAAAKKLVLSALNAQDPWIVMSLSDDGNQVKARTTAILSASMLNAELSPHGISIASMVLVMEDPGSPGVLSATPAAAPVYANTGSPANDAAAYDAAMQAWQAQQQIAIDPQGK